MSQQQAAAVLLLPFLVIYMVFLIYPFFRGIWISFHLIGISVVAFNPDAKEFVGLKITAVSWGKNITWSFFHSPFWQTGGYTCPGYFLGKGCRAVEKFFGVADNFYSIFDLFCHGSVS